MLLWQNHSGAKAFDASLLGLRAERREGASVAAADSGHSLDKFGQRDMIVVGIKKTSPRSLPAIRRDGKVDGHDGQGPRGHPQAAK